MILQRRDFLLGAATASLLPAGVARGATRARLAIRVASNQGAENAALQRLMDDRGFADRLALDLSVIESRDIAGPIAALEADRADLCMISAFAGVLPAIERGQPVRVIGTAMRVPALAVCATRPDVREVKDLIGRRIGIGEPNGLLHLVMQALLRRHAIPIGAVRFVTVGSNAQVFHAILSGAVDAGPCGVANLSDRRTHVVDGGDLWRALPHFSYQLAYASTVALRDRGAAVARCLAAYSLLFRFVSGPDSRDAYLAARSEVGGDAAEGEAMWAFIQRAQPYPARPSLSANDIRYLQRLNVSAGLQEKVLPFPRVADMAPIMAARRLLA